MVRSYKKKGYETKIEDNVVLKAIDEVKAGASIRKSTKVSDYLFTYI